MTDILLDLQNLTRSYTSGETIVRALAGVTLTIRAGEFVAIMGQSGSGKSTLMNLIGCLDRPSSGTYLVKGRNVADLSPDELASLRRTTFGFVFQRYNLLNTATADENVEIPAVYAGMAKKERILRARDLLKRLGLADRAGHRPSQLSGGQQQRVAIARALMNDPPVILADEPTGALDSRSGQEVMDLLKSLHAEGRTIILITHDEKVAANAKRVIRIHDGIIDSDEGDGLDGAKTQMQTEELPESGHAGILPELSEASKTAIRALKVNLFRTLLTLLGIIIGVAAVITMLAIGQGSKQKVLTQISAMGTNLLSIRPGMPGMRPSGDIASLSVADADALLDIGNVEMVVPERQSNMTIRYGNIDDQTTVLGTGAGMPVVRDWAVKDGTFFSDKDLQSYAPVVVVGQTVVKTLFPDDDAPPVGKFVLVGNIPFQIIGTMVAKGSTPWGQDQDDQVFIPITTGLVRLFGKNYISSITLKVKDVKTIDATEDAITTLLTVRHKTEDFNVRNTASILAMATETQNTLTYLLGAVAAISLLVGGIGVMNIMLVSVTERTREIGIRMATGARRRDIMLQFNTEAAVVCIIGGLLGIAFGILAGTIISLFGTSVVFSPLPAALAFSCAVLTGLLFGYLPARKASRLDPVVALASE